MAKIDVRLTCLAGPKCHDMTPVAGIISLLFNHGKGTPEPAKWRGFEASKPNGQIHLEVKQWCLETARAQTKHALIVGFPHSEEHWKTLDEFTDYSVIWFGNGRVANKPAMAITGPTNLTDVIRCTLNRLPTKQEVRAELLKQFMDEKEEWDKKHPAHKALRTILARRNGNQLAQLVAA